MIEDYLWDSWGLFCGSILIVGVFYQIPFLFQVGIGGGGMWVFLQSIMNLREVNQRGTGK